MITWILDGKKIRCPSCYEELKTGTFQRIISEWDPEQADIGKRDFFKLFNILTSTDFKIQASSENEVTIWNAVHWYFTQPFQFSTELPKVLQIGDKNIFVPRKAGALSAGQNIHLRDAITKCTYMEQCISSAVAIALQPLYDEAKYDIDRAKELEKLILEMPIYLTHPVGFFLLQTVRGYGQKRMSDFPRTRNNLVQNLKRMLPKWRRSGGSKSLTIYH